MLDFYLQQMNKQTYIANASKKYPKPTETRVYKLGKQCIRAFL